MLTERGKQRIRKLGAALVWTLGICMVLGPVLFSLGCSAGASSEITPAKSAAADRTIKVTAPAKRKYRVTITMPPAAPDVVDIEEGEDK